MTDILERRNPLTALLLALLLVGSAGLSSCGELSDRQTEQVQQALNDTLLSSTESWDVDMELMEEGLRKVRIQGAYAASYDYTDSSWTRIGGPVTIQLFDSTGGVETRAFSSRAIYRAQQSIFQLYGNVRVRSQSGRRLRTEYLKWDRASNRVSTPRFVIITTPSDSIAGNGFEGTSDLSEYTIREVTGQFIID